MTRTFIPALLVLSATLPAQAELFSFYTSLHGGNVTPPNASSGWGSASVLYDTETMEFGLGGTLFSLSSGVTGGSINLGLQGVDGPVVISLTDVPLGFQSGAINVGPVVLTAEQEADLFFGRWYVTIPTLEYSGGEIRGQLMLGGAAVPEPAHYAALVGGGLVAFGVVRRCRAPRR